jgi:hypothetical protein
VPAVAAADPAGLDKAAKPDPIFAAIERHREAEALRSRADEDQVQDCEQVGKAMVDAFYRVWDIVPTTLTGRRAKIDFAARLDQFADADSDFVETLYQSACLNHGESHEHRSCIGDSRRPTRC